MFDWIFPSFLMQNTPSIAKQKSQIRVLTVTQLDELYSFSHPFLTCPDTIAHLRQTKVMFLMRGLPGSGKSTLVNKLKEIYSRSYAICSADNYFLDSQGVYRFDRAKISEAHRVCQLQAEDACRTNVLAVIIDNTNIRVDECRPYFQKASTYGYIVLVVEARTSWKRDANILMSRNSHEVPMDVIEARLQQYHPLIPFYFGLFLNHEQSMNVLRQAFDYYQQGLQNFPQLKKDLEQISRNKNISVNGLLSRSNMKVQPKILHCTLKYIGRPDDQSRKEYTDYAGNRLVSHLIGKMCRGFIVGFVITERTLGARLLFPDRHTWALWAQNDNETPPKNPFPSSSHASSGDTNSKSRSNRRNNKSKQTRMTTTTTTDEFDTSVADEDDLLLVDKIVKSNQTEQMSFLHPTFGFLSRAHLTCGVAPDVKAERTGFDMIEMIQKENDILQQNISVPESNDERTVMKYFGNGTCIVYLKEPIPIETIFTGSFN